MVLNLTSSFEFQIPLYIKWIAQKGFSCPTGLRGKDGYRHSTTRVESSLNICRTHSPTRENQVQVTRAHTHPYTIRRSHTHTRTQQHVWKEANKQNNWIKWRVFCLSRCLSTFIFHLVFFYLKQVHLLDPSEQKNIKGGRCCSKALNLLLKFFCWHLDVIVYSYAVSNLWPDNRNKGIALQTLSLTLSGAAFYFVVSFFLIGRYLVACVISSARTRNDLSLSRLSRLVLYTAYAKRPVGWMSRLDPARRRRRRRRLRTLGRALMTRSPCALLPPLAETNSWGERLRHITHMTRRSDCETTTTILFYI